MAHVLTAAIFILSSIQLAHLASINNYGDFPSRRTQTDRRKPFKSNVDSVADICDFSNRQQFTLCRDDQQPEHNINLVITDASECPCVTQNEIDKHFVRKRLISKRSKREVPTATDKNATDAGDKLPVASDNAIKSKSEDAEEDDAENVDNSDEGDVALEELDNKAALLGEEKQDEGDELLNDAGDEFKPHSSAQPEDTLLNDEPDEGSGEVADGDDDDDDDDDIADDKDDTMSNNSSETADHRAIGIDADDVDTNEDDDDENPIPNPLDVKPANEDNEDDNKEDHHKETSGETEDLSKNPQSVEETHEAKNVPLLNSKGKAGDFLTADTDSEESDSDKTPDVDNNDPSKTYDPSKSVNPFGLDNPSLVKDALGKMLGIDEHLDSKEEDNTLEGSGSVVLTSDGEIDNDFIDKDEIIKVKVNDVNSARADGKDDGTDKTSGRQSPSSDDDYVPGKEGGSQDSSAVGPLGAPEDGTGGGKESKPSLNSLEKLRESINEMGIDKLAETNADATPAPEENDTAASSTGSFIILGAIMATFVVLVGYSVFKSQRAKKQATKRTPQQAENATEMKELLSENGHCPAKIVKNVETDALLTSHDDKENGILTQNGVNGAQPLSSFKVENSNQLSEVKVAPTANGINDSKDTNEDGRESWVYGTQPEATKAKMFIDHDSIPKTPIVIVKRGPSDM